MAHDPDEEDTDRRQHPTAAELKRHRRTIPGGTPILPDLEPPAEPDDPGFEWPVAPDRRDAEVLRRAGRDPEVPVAPAEVSAIVRKLIPRLRDELSRLLTDGPADLVKLRETVADHSRIIGPVRSTASWALKGAVSVLLAIIGGVYYVATTVQHTVDEIQSVRETNQRLEREINALRQTPIQIKDTRP